MGYSVRSRTYRYTEWVRFNRRSFKPVWSSVEATELYDHSVDPGEDVNLSDDPRYIEVRDMLSNVLHRQNDFNLNRMTDDIGNAS